MSNAITFRMAQGVPGALSRTGIGETVEQIAYGATAFSAFGLAGKLSGNTLIPPAASTDAIYGLLVRPFPIEDFAAQTGAPNTGPALGTATPPTAGVANVMTRGYMTVKVGTGGGTPALGAAVYVRYANGTAALPVGGLEATSVSGSNVAVPNCRFTGSADANGNCEVFFDNP